MVNRLRRSLLLAAPAALVLRPFAAAAQGPLRIEITQGVIEPLPFAAPPFLPDSPAAADLANQITQVVIDDLTGTGLFRQIPPSAFIGKVTNFDAPVQFADWKAINAQALITGAVGVAGDKATVRFRLWDVFAQAGLGDGLQFQGPTASWRRLGHKVADAVYSRLTGEGGYFDSKVAYIAESGPKNARRKQVALMDYDGFNARTLTDGNALVVTPQISIKARQILYTSYELGSPRIFVMNVDGSGRHVLDQDAGMSFAPEFSPDGTRVVYSVSEGTGSDIVISGLGGGGRKQLTKSASIDTAPSFSPDGSQIVFESDRSGSQQIYMMSASGASPSGSASARALCDAGLVAARRSHRLHQDRRRPVPYRRDAARRLERAAPDRELYRRGPDLGPERAGADVLPREPGRKRRPPDLYRRRHRAEPAPGPDRRLRLGPVLVRIAGLT